MKIKIAVIEDQRKIVVRMTGCENAVQDYIKKHTGLHVDSPKVYLKSSYRASAKCHPDDTWNEEEGRRLANDRVRDKYIRDFNKALRAVQAEFESFFRLPGKGTV